MDHWSPTSLMQVLGYALRFPKLRLSSHLLWIKNGVKPGRSAVTLRVALAIPLLTALRKL